MRRPDANAHRRDNAAHRRALEVVGRLGYVFEDGEADFLAAQLLVRMRHRLNRVKRAQLADVYAQVVEQRAAKGADPEIIAERRAIAERVSGRRSTQNGSV